MIVQIWAATAHATPISDADAVRAIIGEAEGESFKGKVAVAEAIRNRGTLRGVYGFKAKRVDQAPDWVWREARRAWKKSKQSNLVKGATHFESTDFPIPGWSKKMRMTAHIGKHKFYKAYRQTPK